MAARQKRSADSDKLFFTALENAHPVSAACRAAGYAPASVYRWRKEDAEFAERWNNAMVMAGDLLEEEADRRGRDGYDQPVYFRGKKVGVKRRYSDGLLHARLKAVRPHQYRDRAPLPPEAPRVQTVMVRDFVLEDELLRLLDIDRILPEDLTPMGRERIERIREVNAGLDADYRRRTRTTTPLSHLSHESAQIRPVPALPAPATK
jgi:hypothetical protein